MTMNPQATATARRNLVHRIRRFIDGPAATPPPLTTDQLANLFDALAALEQGTYSVGEDAMMLAEKGWKPRQSQVGPAKPIEELLAHFERLLGEG